MKFIKYIALTVALVYLSGCTTMADSIAGKGSGPFRIYEKPKSEVWPVAVEAVNSSGLKLITSNESSNLILAQRGITAFSYGENVAIFVEEHNDNQCRVEVVSKKSMQTNIFAPDWSNDIFKYLDSKFN